MRTIIFFYAVILYIVADVDFNSMIIAALVKTKHVFQLLWRFACFLVNTQFTMRSCNVRLNFTITTMILQFTDCFLATKVLSEAQLGI